jgi:hypothetical protein
MPRCTVLTAWERNLLCHAPGRDNGAGALCRCSASYSPHSDAFGMPVEPCLQLADRDQLAAPQAHKPHVGFDMRAPRVPGHAQRFARLLDAERQGGRTSVLGGKSGCRTWQD